MHLFGCYTLNNSTHKQTCEWRIKQRILPTYILCDEFDTQKTFRQQFSCTQLIFSVYFIYFVMLTFSDSKITYGLLSLFDN